MCTKQAALNLQQAYENFSSDDVYVVAAIANYSQADDLNVLDEFYELHDLTCFMSGNDQLGQYSTDFCAAFTVIGNCNVIINQHGADVSPAALTAAITEGMESFEYLHLQAPIADMDMTVNDENTIDLSQVFNDPDGNAITFSVDENTAPSIISASITGSNLLLASNTESGIVDIRLKAEVGEREVYEEFTVFVNVVSSVFAEEGFEHDGAFPADWTQEHVSGQTDWAIQSGGQDGYPVGPYEGFYNAALYIASTIAEETKMISPVYDMSGLLGARLEFYHAQALWSADQDELEIYCRASASDEWILLAEYRQDTPSWLKREVNIPIEALSSEFQIAFHGIAKYGYAVCVDDIAIVAYQIDNDIADVKAHSKVAFLKNYPNPFNPVTNINFCLEAEGSVALNVYNTKGQLIKSLVEGKMNAGSHSVIWNGTNNTGESVSSGVYFCRIESGAQAPVTRKMILMK